jgi:hypothetical protein
VTVTRQELGISNMSDRGLEFHVRGGRHFAAAGTTATARL